jgi:hypothetical protein
MQVSKYLKVDKDILIEYIYDDGNLISEPYKILVNSKDTTNSYVAGDSTITKNNTPNQLFKIDPVNNVWGVVDPNTYNFLQLKDYSAGAPVRHDRIKVHVPINYTFGEYFGFHIRIYTFDYTNRFTYDLSNFYWDITDNNTFNFLEFNSPALLISEKVWGKSIEFNVPSLSVISNQRSQGATTPNSINFNLTNGFGLSLNTPIFIDFSFITQKTELSGVKRYTLASKVETVVPQTPEFENIAVMIEESKAGDFFEIYGTFNGNSSEFNTFIENSIFTGSRYNVEYTLTIFEQNIRGKSLKFYVDRNFDEKIEFRPIIKFSTTTAIISVEMRMIDIVNNSEITRRASYGMLQDQVSKYSLNLTKINLANASKPKIYNIKNPAGVGIFSGETFDIGVRDIRLEPVKVPFPVFVERFNLVAKSDNNSVIVGRDTFYSNGALEILVNPFDNVFKFIIADRINDEQIEYLDLSTTSDVRMVIKNDQITVNSPLYIESGEVDLERGVVVFKINSNRINDIKKIYNSNQRLFYITTTNESMTTSIYIGLFELSDSLKSQDQFRIRNNAETPVINPISGGGSAIAVPDRTSAPTEATLTTTSTTTFNPFSFEGGGDFSNPSIGIIDGPAVTLIANTSYSISGPPITLYWKVISLVEESGELTGKTSTTIFNIIDDLQSESFDKLENINYRLQYSSINNITGKNANVDSDFSQTIEFALQITAISLRPNLTLKSVKLNSTNQFTELSSWSNSFVTQDTTNKLITFSFKLKPTDNLVIEIGDQ